MGQKKNIISYIASFFVVACVAALTIESSGANAVVSTNYHLASPRVPGAGVGGAGDIRAQIQSPNSISSDGRYIVFSSISANIVSNDTDDFNDVFIRDTQNSTTTRLSVAQDGTQGNSHSRTPSISYDGRYVVFSSNANNLVSGVPDTSKEHVYIRNLITGVISIVDTAANGDLNSSHASYPSVSAEGRFVVFQSNSVNLVSGVNSPTRNQIYIKDMYSGAIKALSKTSTGVVGNDDSYQPTISCDGNIVVFPTESTNLGVPSGQSSRRDLAVVHLGWTSDKLDLITPSLAHGIYGSAQVSCDGNTILYLSTSTNVVSPATASGYMHAYQYNRLTGTTIQTSLGNNNAQPDSPQHGLTISASMSADGRYVAFATAASNVDTTYPFVNPSSSASVYIRDIKNSTTELASILPSGNRSQWVPAQSGMAMSANGSVIAFAHTTPSMNNPSRALIPGVNSGLPTLSWSDIYSTQTGH